MTDFKTIPLGTRLVTFVQFRAQGQVCPENNFSYSVFLLLLFLQSFFTIIIFCITCSCLFIQGIFFNALIKKSWIILIFVFKYFSFYFFSKKFRMSNHALWLWSSLLMSLFTLFRSTSLPAPIGPASFPAATANCSSPTSTLRTLWTCVPLSRWTEALRLTTYWWWNRPPSQWATWKTFKRSTSFRSVSAFKLSGTEDIFRSASFLENMNDF